MKVSPVTFASYIHLLGGNRNFRRLWSAQAVSEIGDWFYTLANYNLLLQLTGRAGSVALALVLQVLPGSDRANGGRGQRSAAAQARHDRGGYRTHIDRALHVA